MNPFPNRFMAAIDRWWHYDPYPNLWKFWYPQSGGVGGLIGGMLIAFVVCATAWLTN